TVKKSKAKRRRKKKELSPKEKEQELVQRRLYREFRAFVRALGFSRIRADKIEISVGGRKGEFDDVFIYENLILLVEYTTGKPESSHVLKNKPLYDNIIADIPRFLRIASEKYADMKPHLSALYDPNQYRLRIL